MSFADSTDHGLRHAEGAEGSTQNGDAVGHDKSWWLTTTLETLHEDLTMGRRMVSDIPAVLDAMKHLSSGINDRLFLLEKLIVLMSSAKENSEFATKLQSELIEILYRDLPHPPSGYLAVPSGINPDPSTNVNNGVTYAYRSADGSNYNPLFPTLGKAGSPYARSVPSQRTIPPSALPDAALVFDTLLRRDEFIPHPGGLSSLFFAFANLVIHSVFNTSQRDWMINNSASYLDLSPLYGSSVADWDKVRRKDGTGKLWHDVFSDNRLLFMPPSTAALLVLFNRNHNYIAERILNINERRTLSNPPPKDTNARAAQDDEIFHRARLVNCGFFVQVILGDYVGAILGLVRDGSSWRLNPLTPKRQLNHEWSPVGEGNVVSVEFNFLYRWHATLSQHDTEWTEATFKKMFEGKDFNQVGVKDFIQGVHKYMIPDPDPRKWTFGELKRDQDGRFDDAQLANIIQTATESPASSFKARGIPEVLRVVEILGIEQARTFGTCSLNEFRKFMGLKPYASFEEWNPDSKISRAAEALYHDINNLELHVGLQAEESKKPMPGAGLCPGFTISRAILGDAVCLTRGDRFLTVDFTPFNLTSWGFQDCQFNTNDGSYGGMLTKLLYRTLPSQYPIGSAYAHFPMMVPETMKGYLEKLKNSPVEKYDFSRPDPAPNVLTIRSSKDVQRVLSDPRTFSPGYLERLSALSGNVALHQQEVRLVLTTESSLDKYGRFFFSTTQNLLQNKSIDHVNVTARFVDVVKDVINLVPVYWIATEIAGLPMKTSTTPKGVFTYQELYSKLADICNFVLLDADHYDDWTLRERSITARDAILHYTKLHLEKLAPGGVSSEEKDSILARLAGSMKTLTHVVEESLIDHWQSDTDHSDEFLRPILEAVPAPAGSRSHEQLADSIFAEAMTTTASYSLAVTHIVNYYLDDNMQVVRDELSRLSADQSKTADGKILGYAYEALRKRFPVASVSRTVKADFTIEKASLHPGDQILCDLTSADQDVDRTNWNVLSMGLGDSGLLNSTLFDKTVPQVLRAIFALQNVKRAPGLSGQLNSFTQDREGITQTLYLNFTGEVTPWPASLIIQYGPDVSVASPTQTNGITANGSAHTRESSVATGSAATASVLNESARRSLSFRKTLRSSYQSLTRAVRQTMSSAE